MPSQWASGKHSIAQCDRCNFRYKLKELKTQTVKTKPFKIKVCPTCWDPDQPQLQLGMYPVNDPQAVREPRSDNSYLQSGNTGLQTVNTGGTEEDEFGYPAMGSRVIQWGWNPVGGSRGPDAGLTPNDLVQAGLIGTVTVVITNNT
jgi:hypothetical protein